jgi:hypothetical protein
MMHHRLLDQITAFKGVGEFDITKALSSKYKFSIREGNVEIALP